MKIKIAITLLCLAAVIAFGQRAGSGGGSTTPSVPSASVDLTGTNDGGGTGILTNLSAVYSDSFLDNAGNPISGGAAGESIIGPSDWHGWMPGYGSTVSNAAAPVYWSTTDANGDVPAFGFTSSDAVTPQSRYAFAVHKIPQAATGWNGNLTITIKQSSTTAADNTLAFRIAVPGGGSFSTSLVCSAANTVETYTIPQASLPTFVAPTTTSNITTRVDFLQYNGATNSIVAIKLPWQ